MKNVVYSIPLDEMADRVYRAQNELLEDRSDEYLLDSNLWTDAEHVMANLCLNMDDARMMELDKIVGIVENGVTEWYAIKNHASAKHGEDYKLKFAPEAGIVLFSLIKVADEVR